MSGRNCLQFRALRRNETQAPATSYSNESCYPERTRLHAVRGLRQGAQARSITVGICAAGVGDSRDPHKARDCLRRQVLRTGGFSGAIMSSRFQRKRTDDYNRRFKVWIRSATAFPGRDLVFALPFAGLAPLRHSAHSRKAHGSDVCSSY